MTNEESTKIYMTILDAINKAEKMMVAEHTSEQMASYYQGQIHALKDISIKIKGM